MDPLRILYVDDSHTLCVQVSSALERAGHVVVTALDFRGAIKALPEQDLVILDLHMPEHSGADMLAPLRASGRVSPHTVFYLYTSDAVQSQRFRELGFDGAFTAKGDTARLVSQVSTAARAIGLRAFMAQRR
jgi:CheY-like chemotaxis protein